MTARFVPAALVVLAATALAGMVIFATSMMGMGGGHMRWSGGGSDPAREAAVAAVTDVRIEDFAFSPANIVVDLGATVTWTNEDRAGHTVTSDDGGVLDSALLDDGEAFRYTFDTPGEYAYHCEPHPNMRGLVTVRPGG